MSCNNLLSAAERDKLINVLEADLCNRVRSIRNTVFVRDTKSFLREFGCWARQGVNVGGVRSSIQIFVEMANGDTSRCAEISDDEAMSVNDALVALMRKDSESANILLMVYVSNMPEYLVAERMYISRPRVKSLVSRGEGYIEGFLDNAKAA
jgi:hypothetical protein